LIAAAYDNEEDENEELRGTSRDTKAEGAGAQAGAQALPNPNESLDPPRAGRADENSSSSSYESSSEYYSSSEEDEKDDGEDKKKGKASTEKEKEKESLLSSDSESSEDSDGAAAAGMIDSIIKSKGWQALNQMDSEEDEDSFKNAPRTKNEVAAPEKPEPLDVHLTKDDSYVVVGNISGIIENTVVIEYRKGCCVYDMGSLFCARTGNGEGDTIPLGLVDEVFGPVKAPLYTLRCDPEVVKAHCTVGMEVFALNRLSKHVVEKELYSKGYDNSGKHDEEVNPEEENFSDDEKEMDAKKKRRQRKRNMKGDLVKKPNSSSSNHAMAHQMRRQNHQMPQQHHQHQHQQQYGMYAPHPFHSSQQQPHHMRPHPFSPSHHPVGPAPSNNNVYHHHPHGAAGTFPPTFPLPPQHQHQGGYPNHSMYNNAYNYYQQGPGTGGNGNGNSNADQ
jgi:H/ACA ribonucleoprotein complex non-core subunit NAF1